MNRAYGKRPRWAWAIALISMLGSGAPAARAGDDTGRPVQTEPPFVLAPEVGSHVQAIAPPSPQPDPETILTGGVQPIDLNTALRLAGVQNPELLVARQRVVEAVALRQLAAAQILPTINGGMNYDIHTGNLQQSNGNILAVNRAAVYVGAGSGVTAAGTVPIPGLVLAGNVAQGVYLYLGSKQLVRQREFASLAERNQQFLRVCLAYCELARAEGRHAVAREVRDSAAELARITAAYAKSGEGRVADADRAATFLAQRQADVRDTEGEILTASAELARLLNLDPSMRLHPTDAWVVPLPIVPEPMPLCELIALALLRRPELGERRAAIQEALLALEGARVLPFSPTVLVGFSSGGFGGGSNLVRPIFGNFAPRSDFDVIAYWSIRNMGVGNLALINAAKARLQTSKFQELVVLNRVRDEVAEAHARTHARFAQIGDQEQAVRSAMQGYQLDLARIRQAVPTMENRAPRPIEVLDSLRLLRESLDGYLNAIVDYNRAHFQLYVALGQPPADALARPIPTGGIAPAGSVPPSEPATPVTNSARTAAPPPPAIRSPFAPNTPPALEH